MLLLELLLYLLVLLLLLLLELWCVRLLALLLLLEGVARANSLRLGLRVARMVPEDSADVRANGVFA